MPTFTVDWFVGSITIPQQDFTANGFACSIAAGSYYLRHTTANLSLLALFATEVEDQAGVGALGVTVKRSRLVADLWDAPVAVVWGGATALRDLFGYTGDLASATTHTATNISPLLWSPGYPATPTKDIRGSEGYLVPQQVISASDDGSDEFTYHFGEETHQDLEWSHIDPSRLKITGSEAAQGGTFYQFHRQSGMIGRRLLYYQDVVEDAADSTTDVTWPTQLGPYVLRREARSGDWYRRNVPNAEVSSPLSLPLKMLSEYS